MSYILTGLNFTGIKEYNSSNSYEKFDIVDYQLNDSTSLYPSYQGEGAASTDLSFWFNNDYINDFEVDVSSNVTSWNNRGSLKQNTDTSNDLFSISLFQGDPDKRPVINLDANFSILQGNQFLSGTIEQSNDRTFFLCFEVLPFSQDSFDEQSIFSISDTEDFSSNVESIKVKGDDRSGPSASALFVVNGSDYGAKAILYDNPTILTITQSYDSDTQVKSMVVRQNGLEVANLNSFGDGWLGEFLKIADNPNNQGIKYYDFFCFPEVLSDSKIQSYEKYLYETYFNNEGLFFAKADVPAGVDNGPLTLLGNYYYWTRDINDLFSLSYGCVANFSAKLSNSKFGDGYQSNISRNINSLQSNFELKYDGLTDKQAKCLITFFENTPESPLDVSTQSFTGVSLDLFPPYKQNSDIYFTEINHETPYNNINNISIKSESLYDSSLDYKGMFVQLDESSIRTYSDSLSNFEYNDVVYVDSVFFNDRGYYYYTGQKTQTTLDSINGPLGNESYFTKEFYFKQDVEYDFNSNVRLNIIDYEGSTKQFIKDGINYNVLNFELKFSNRSDKEARAILKFLDSKAGYKLFSYTLPQPYNKKITVFAPEWSHTHKFLDSNDITVKFYEFLAPPNRTVFFNTKIDFIEAPSSQDNFRSNFPNIVLYGVLINRNGVTVQKKF